jgi:hypothetical protein
VFQANGGLFKFVDEAYVDRFDDYVNACFRAKFEYKDRNTWKRASEAVEKIISSAVMHYSVSSSSNYYRTETAPLGDYRYDGQELTVCTMVWPTAGTCAREFVLTADFSSYLSHPVLGEHGYGVSGGWYNEFLAIGESCN